ncbi:MAG: hypothetical protein HY671_07930 [Chloroflexi bacterium]|nr:hypothetical protein [Chloroflexota bacterium]
MTGHEYLKNIKKELEAGRWQHKKGISILASFGYSRRRKAALATINKEMETLGLKANPPIDENMPLDSSHVTFSLRGEKGTTPVQPPQIDTAEVEEEIEGPELEPFIPTFRVRDLAAADKPVRCIKTNDPLKKAYIIMLKNKYSQLVVADTHHPLSTAILIVLY